MINGYDFDGTIYDGDSSVDFTLYCIKRKPSILKKIPIQLKGIVLYKLKIKDKDYMKENLFSYLSLIDNIDEYIDDFWNSHYKKIKDWYIKQKKSTDVIISASPEFLLKPLEKKLKVGKVIATKVNKKTGKFESKNCHDYEKINRFEKEYKKNTINEFYSDSIKADKAMLDYAKTGYIVNKNEITRYEDVKGNQPSKQLKIISVLAILLLMLSIAPIIGVSLYNHPSADDYNYSTKTFNALKEDGLIGVLKGAIDTVEDTYKTWQGTYSAVFVMSLQPCIWGENLYFIGTIILVTVFLLAHYMLTREILCNRLKIDRASFLIIFSIITFISMQTVPSLTESFFWWNGSSYYTLFYSLFLVEITLLLKFQRTNKKKYYFIICLLNILIAGSNFVTALQQVIILSFINFYFIVFKKDKRFIPFLLLSVLGLVVSMLAPGNAFRQEQTEKMGAIKAIIMSFMYAIKYLVNWNNIPNIMAVITIIMFMYKSYNNINFKFKYPLIMTILTFCIFSAQFTPSLYAQSNPGPSRLMNIIYYSHYILLISNLYYWGGWFRTKLKENNVLTKNSFENFQSISNKYTAVATTIIFALVLPSMYLNIRSYSTIKALIPIKNGSAKIYKEEYNERLKLLKSNKKDIVFEPYSIIVEPLFYADVTEDETSWLNVPQTQIYNKDSIKLSRKYN